MKKSKVIERGFKGYNWEYNSLRPSNVPGGPVIKAYKPGNTYKKPFVEHPELCTDQGFHFCRKPEDVWQFYPPVPSNRYTYVSVPEGAGLTKGSCKSSTTILRIGEAIYDAFSFAKKFFKRTTEKTTYFNCNCVGENYAFYSEDSEVDSSICVIGIGNRQCLETDINPVIALGHNSLAHSSHRWAVTTKATSTSESKLGYAIGYNARAGKVAFSFPSAGAGCAEALSKQAVAIGGAFTTAFKGVAGSLFVCYFVDNCSEAAIATARVGDGGIEEGKWYKYYSTTNKWVECFL